MRSFLHSSAARPNRLLFALILGASLTACSGESSETLLQKAQQSLDSGDRKAAIIQLKSAIQEDDKNAEARFQLGKLQIEMGDFASAEKELRRAREAGYDADTVNPLLAKALIGQGEFRRVLEDLPEPEKGSPVEVPLLVVRATAQIGAGDKEEARS
ncbi:MAG: tetratricopeptide repeat protein, partial [Caldilinea sp.]